MSNANTKTELHEFTADGQLVTGPGVVVGLICTTNPSSLDLHDGTSASDPKIASTIFTVAGDWCIFPDGHMPEFVTGLYANVTGTTPACKVYTA